MIDILNFFKLRIHFITFPHYFIDFRIEKGVDNSHLDPVFHIILIILS